MFEHVDFWNSMNGYRTNKCKNMSLRISINLQAQIYLHALVF